MLRRADAWARRHPVLFYTAAYATTVGALMAFHAVTGSDRSWVEVMFVAAGGFVGSALGWTLRRRRTAAGPLPDGKLMQWWERLPGPSKDPADYR